MSGKAKETGKEGVLVIDPVAHIAPLPFLAYESIAGKLQLMIDGISCTEVVQQFGTPCYVYSRRAIEAAYQAYKTAFSAVDNHVCYAVKANSNLAVLKILADLGAGFDVVSKGELLRVWQATGGKDGAIGARVVYSGVGKTADDVATALNLGIACFNVEAASELDLLNQTAQTLGKIAPISLRVNPDVDAKTHPYIATGLKDNKFGIDIDKARQLYHYAATLPHLDIVGIDCHIGSQLLEAAPFVAAVQKVADLVAKLQKDGIILQHIDIGGGVGVRYIAEKTLPIAEYAQALLPILLPLNLTVYLEPGRNLVANAGVLLTRVDVLKPTDEKNFAIVDASMSELLRPALYGATMAIVPSVLSESLDKSADSATAVPTRWDVVGSVCESSDFLGKNRALVLAVGDVLAITGAGAYGFTMASNYNSRPRPCEVLVERADGKAAARVVRRREQYCDLWAAECV